MPLSKIQDIGNQVIPNLGPNRNVIINGAMNVAQRGTSFASALGYTLDRYAYYRSGTGVVTVSQDTDTPTNFKNSLKVAVTTNDSSMASGDYYVLQQKIEGQNIAHFNYGSSDAKTTTLSFFVKSSVTGTYSGSLRNNATDRSFVFQYTVSSANTWEEKSITIVGDTSGTWLTNNSTGIVLAFSLGQGTTYASSTVGSWHSGNYHGSTSEQDFITNASATFFITGLSLEIGQKATEFEHEPFERTLAKCHRYYYALLGTIGGGNGQEAHVCTAGAYNDTNAYGGVPFPVTMRATPTLVHLTGTNYWQFYNDNHADTFDGFTMFGENQSNSNKAFIYNADTISTTKTNAGNFQGNNGGCYLHFTAEL